MQGPPKEAMVEPQKPKYDGFEDPNRDFRLLTVKSRGYSKSRTAQAGEIRPSVHVDSAGNAEIQIYCELSNVSRHSCSKYMALSYEWGRLFSEQPIIVKSCDLECRMTVTLNLHLALQHLVKEDEDLVIWIDAICINQSDKAEKGLQLPYMRVIYAQAEETFVWLGPSIIDEGLSDDAVVKAINLVGKELCDSGIVKLMTDLDRYSNTNQKLYDKKLAEIDRLYAEQFKSWERHANLIRRGLGRVRRLSYWNRVWIIQEITTSKKITLAWGHNKIQAPHLHAYIIAAEKFLIHVVSLARESLQRNEVLDDELVQCIMGNIEAYSLMHSSVWGIRDRYHAAGQTPREPLLKLLARTSIPSLGTNIRSDCSVPHDRVFGLLGIASDKGTLAISPTYEKPFGVIYEETARAIIAGGTLDLLAYSQFPKSDPELPTWVPDWRMQLQSDPLEGVDKELNGEVHNHWGQHIHKPYGDHPWDTAFKASGDRAFKPSDEFIFTNASSPPSHSPLVLRGVRIDTVSSFKKPWAFDIARMYSGNLALIPSHLNDIKSLIEESNAKGTEIYRKPSDRETAFYRIPIADREMNSNGFCHAATDASRVGYELVGEDLARGAVLDSTAKVEKSSYWNMMEMLQYRRPFITERGFVGLGPQHLAKGDVVVVFLGAKFPYILRKGPQGWTLVGEAYVHGIMYGEFMENTEENMEEIFSLY